MSLGCLPLSQPCVCPCHPNCVLRPCHALPCQAVGRGHKSEDDLERGEEAALQCWLCGQAALGGFGRILGGSFWEDLPALVPSSWLCPAASASCVPEGQGSLAGALQLFLECPVHASMALLAAPRPHSSTEGSQAAWSLSWGLALPLLPQALASHGTRAPVSPPQPPACSSEG